MVQRAGRAFRFRGRPVRLGMGCSPRVVARPCGGGAVLRDRGAVLTARPCCRCRYQWGQAGAGALGVWVYPDGDLARGAERGGWSGR